MSRYHIQRERKKVRGGHRDVFTIMATSRVGDFDEVRPVGRIDEEPDAKRIQAIFDGAVAPVTPQPLGMAATPTQAPAAVPPQPSQMAATPEGEPQDEKFHAEVVPGGADGGLSRRQIQQQVVEFGEDSTERDGLTEQERKRLRKSPREGHVIDSETRKANEPATRVSSANSAPVMTSHEKELAYAAAGDQQAYFAAAVKCKKQKPQLVQSRQVR